MYDTDGNQRVDKEEFLVVSPILLTSILHFWPFYIIFCYCYYYWNQIIEMCACILRSSHKRDVMSKSRCSLLNINQGRFQLSIICQASACQFNSQQQQHCCCWFKNNYQSSQRPRWRLFDKLKVDFTFLFRYVTYWVVHIVAEPILIKMQKKLWDLE